MENGNFDFQTSSLFDLEIMLMISCDNQYRMSLLEVWDELTDEFTFLNDFYSDYAEPENEIHYALEWLTEIQDLSSVMPQYIDNIRRWLLLCTKYFFTHDKYNQKSVILHEIGHIVVIERKILNELRSKHDDIETLFDVFCSNINRDFDFFKKIESDLRELFGHYIFDVLKIPGEYYANLWVKNNCNEYFNTLLESQFNNYINADKEMRKNIKNRLLKYFFIYQIMKLQMLTMLIENKGKLYNDIVNHIDNLLCDLKLLLNESHYYELLDLTENIKKLYNDPDDVNAQYFTYFIKYINFLKLQPQDFLPI